MHSPFLAIPQFVSTVRIHSASKKLSGFEAGGHRDSILRPLRLPYISRLRSAVRKGGDLSYSEPSIFEEFVKLVAGVELSTPICRYGVFGGFSQSKTPGGVRQM